MHSSTLLDRRMIQFNKDIYVYPFYSFRNLKIIPSNAMPPVTILQSPHHACVSCWGLHCAKRLHYKHNTQVLPEVLVDLQSYSWTCGHSSRHSSSFSTDLRATLCCSNWHSAYPQKSARTVGTTQYYVRVPDRIYHTLPSQKSTQLQLIKYLPIFHLLL